MWAESLNLRVFGMQMVFKVTGLNKIKEDGSSDKKKISEDWSLGTLIFWGQRDEEKPGKGKYQGEVRNVVSWKPGQKNFSK